MTAGVVDPEEEALWGVYYNHNSNRVVRIEMEPDFTLTDASLTLTGGTP